MSTSRGPFTDESWNVINARNLVLLGRWSTDDWNLHLVNVPFSLIEAAVFSVLGVGIAQARLVSIAATALTVFVIGVGLRPRLGAGPAIVAAIAFGTSTLVLFYGRLAFLEPTVTLWLTAGGLLALRATSDRAGRFGVLAGLALALAIGTKPSAAFAAAGIVVGSLIVGGPSPTVRRWVGGAVVVIASAAMAWIALVGLPNWPAVAVDLRIWAAEPIFASLGTMLRQLVSFPVRNDGALRLSIPILVFGGGAWLIAIRARSSLEPDVRVLLGATTGWLIAGFGVLTVAPYRPNRYDVPMLAALAIVGAIGLSAVARTADARLLRWRRPLAIALVVVLAAPGLVGYAGWMRAATVRLPELQRTVAAVLPSGAVIQGDLAPAFAMQARAITLVSRVTTAVNPGDLYAVAGVRWFVGRTREAPAWAPLHAAAWSARTKMFCTAWGSENDCLWRLP